MSRTALAFAALSFGIPFALGVTAGYCFACWRWRRLVCRLLERYP